jgi:hypothetical protein
MSSPLPDIKLTGIGRKSNGATGAEVAGQIMDALSKASMDAGSKMMVNVGDLGKKTLEKVTGGAAGAGDAVKGLLGR